MLVDTHCHLGDPAYDPDRAEVAVRAWDAGVGHVVVVGDARESSDRALDLVRGNGRLSATAGVHPHVASTWSPQTAAWLRERLQCPEVVAAGEMGLDYHYDHSPREVQRQVLGEQLAIAAEAGKAAVIHSREADDDMMAILREHAATRCIMHSYSSGDALLDLALELGHFVSFSGMITFRSWARDDAIRRVPRDSLLVETDGPYLAPVPHRGKRNEPAFVARVADQLASVLECTPEEVRELTGQNARRAFGQRIAA
ncbi:MAG TPA: TatD family hydrolase [Gemmatimonadales bacterium]|nr:TatD family hydrolase [Gemmatimonadales bacterium]